MSIFLISHVPSVPAGKGLSYTLPCVSSAGMSLKTGGVSLAPDDARGAKRATCKGRRTRSANACGKGYLGFKSATQRKRCDNRKICVIVREKYSLKGKMETFFSYGLDAQ